jgi:dockerin type I repeat protein
MRTLSVVLLPLVALLSSARSAPGADFLRGDANRDGALDIADPIALLGQLFSGGEPLPCLDAADVDDSGSLDISDPIGILDYLYRGGRSPEAPFPGAGPDPTADGLGCAGESDGGSLAPDPEDTAAVDGLREARESSREGDPLLVDRSTFEALKSLAGGRPPAAVLGQGADPFLIAFFHGQPPPPPPLAADAIAPIGSDGCFLVPAALIDRRSQERAVAGEFLRGDINADGKVDDDDARILLECLDGAGPCPLSCWDAADADDDGRVSPADAGLIARAAQGLVRLPAPSGAAGRDPTPDELPPCSAGFSVDGAPARTLRVQPPVVCGLGTHRVDLLSIDEEEGGREEGSARLILCSADREACTDDPEPLSLFTQSPTKPPITCRWIMTRDVTPEEKTSSMKQTCFEDGGGIHSVRHGFPLVAWGGGMEIFRTDNGPGPVHYLHTSRTSAGCSTPPSFLSFVESGEVEVRVSLVCLDADGSKSTETCDATVEVEGMYSSRVEAGTSAGPSCDEAPNSVDAMSQDETMCKVNGQTLFDKAVAVQNGNEVTTSPSFDTKFGASYGKSGLAANVGITYGFSSTVTSHTGQATDTLEAFGNAKLNIPVTTHLQAKGRVATSAQNRTSSRTKCQTRVAGIWMVAKTDCPVGEPLFVSEISGEESEVARAKAKAEHFRLTRIGN